MSERENQDKIGEAMILKMQTHDKEKGSTDWIKYTNDLKIPIKVMATIVA